MDWRMDRRMAKEGERRTLAQSAEANRRSTPRGSGGATNEATEEATEATEEATEATEEEED